MKEPRPPRRNGTPLLEARGISKAFALREGLFRRRRALVRAIDDVSFGIAEGETLGLVGESGCGKTTLGRVVVRLTEPTAGRLMFDGTDLLALRGSELRARRRDFQMVFQDPATSLNPRKTIIQAVAEPLRVHGVASRREADAEVRRLIERVGLQPGHAHRYPHEFSGGQRQRINIARALTLRPRLLVLDEPTSALDVSVQAQILNLLKDLQQEFGLTYLFISHNLAVIAHMSDRVAVMYLGRIVEWAPARAIFAASLHPYTRSLIQAVPVPDPDRRAEAPVLPGEIPSALAPPTGCHFHPRCPLAVERCRRETPPLEAHASGHLAACFRANDLGDPSGRVELHRGGGGD
jgi:oligopeptide/dipeptide ABC transporter ATP-binding protein